MGLREIIRDSGATVVVVATPNGADGYIAAAKKETGYGKANLVMTIARNGDAFGSFFRALFSDMKKGTSMPMAWVRLAPQHPNPKAQEGRSLPETIFVCEAGQVALS